jgi:hypothetical protein
MLLKTNLKIFDRLFAITNLLLFFTLYSSPLFTIEKIHTESDPLALHQLEIPKRTVSLEQIDYRQRIALRVSVFKTAKFRLRPMMERVYRRKKTSL